MARYPDVTVRLTGRAADSGRFAVVQAVRQAIEDYLCKTDPLADPETRMATLDQFQRECDAAVSTTDLRAVFTSWVTIV